MYSVIDFSVAVIDFCGRTDATVTLWGCTPLQGNLKGEEAASRHIVWLAVNVEYDDKPPIEFRRALAARLGLRIREELTHDHIEPL